MANRTLFYPKPLIGGGTEQAQSLLSYLEHLALAHNMKPRALLETLLAAYPLEDFAAAIPTVLKRPSIHGHADIGPELRSRLELATGIPLPGATLDKYKAILAAANLTRSETAYCSCCVQEGDELPYVRLLWQVQCVTACPVHNVKLRRGNTCGAAASERLPIQKRPSLGGVCSQCGSVGFRCIIDAPPPASAEEVWVAKQVARLIAVPEEDAARMTAESLRTGLRQLVKSTYGDSVVRASREAGLSRASVCTWIQGGTPGLPWLLQLCFNAGADVIGLLEGRFVALADEWTAGRRHEVLPRSYKYAATDDETVRQLLLSAARLPCPPSLPEFARQHGLHSDTPSHRFPEEAGVLVVARRKYLELEREALYAKAVDTYTRAARALQARGKTVHARALQQESGLAAFSQNEARMRALNAVLVQCRPLASQETRAE